MKKYAILLLSGAIFTAQHTYADGNYTYADDNNDIYINNYINKNPGNEQQPLQNIERPSCTNSGLTYNSAEVGYKVVNGDQVYVRRMATIFDSAMDDNGATAYSDNLEVYCVSKKEGDYYGYIVMCLSNEACPWAR